MKEANLCASKTMAQDYKVPRPRLMQCAHKFFTVPVYDFVSPNSWKSKWKINHQNFVIEKKITSEWACWCCEGMWISENSLTWILWRQSHLQGIWVPLSSAFLRNGHQLQITACAKEKDSLFFFLQQ